MLRPSSPPVFSLHYVYDFACMCICALLARSAQRPERVEEPLELEKSAAVNRNLGVGKQTWVLWKSNSALPTPRQVLSV